ncbi:hypothetical protein MTO96_009741 [Rhipicephalus appendiculatus]
MTRKAERGPKGIRRLILSRASPRRWPLLFPPATSVRSVSPKRRVVAEIPEDGAKEPALRRKADTNEALIELDCRRHLETALIRSAIGTAARVSTSPGARRRAVGGAAR